MAARINFVEQLHGKQKIAIGKGIIKFLRSTTCRSKAGIAPNKLSFDKS